MCVIVTFCILRQVLEITSCSSQTYLKLSELSVKMNNIKMDLQEVGGVVGTGWSWLRIGTDGGHLWVR